MSTTATGDAPGRVRVGCSGWAYDDWRGRAYERDLPTSAWLPRYAEWFDTVEINATFYRLPELTTVAGWSAKAPPGFRFAVKLGQYGTHRKKLRDPESWLGQHVERIAGLGAHLGPNLVQLPPRWSRDPGRLDAFLSAIATTGWRWAVEFRDPTWLHDDTFAALERHGVALCVHDLLPGHPVERTAAWTYVRFHGPRATEDPYRGRYGPDRLSPWVDQLGRWRDEGVDTFAYFNNDFDGHALSDARWLRRALGSPPPGTDPPDPPGWDPWAEDHRPTDFQRAVVGVVGDLREGEIVTYGEVADEVGRPGSAQAVANVLRRADGLPWWRVVPADGRLYRSHEPWQRPLLEDEGHVIDADRRVLG